MPPSAVRRTSSSDSTDSIRKRVGKACDRCRLKKSKCDGSHPCARCKADNAICVFGEKTKSYAKVYPKGYIEVLEQQQAQLVAGLQQAYHRLVDTNVWPGIPLSEAHGQPLTHDILASLDLLGPKNHDSDEHENFEEDCQKLQQRLILKGASIIGRRSSLISEPNHILHCKHARTSLHSTVHSTPILARSARNLDKSFTFTRNALRSPVSQSVAPKLSQPRLLTKPLTLHIEAIGSDNPLAPSWWERPTTRGLLAVGVMEAQPTAQAPPLPEGFQATIPHGNAFELQEESNNMIFFDRPTHAARAQDWINEQIDIDFDKFVHVPM